MHHRCCNEMAYQHGHQIRTLLRLDRRRVSRGSFQILKDWYCTNNIAVCTPEGLRSCHPSNDTEVLGAIQHHTSISDFASPVVTSFDATQKATTGICVSKPGGQDFLHPVIPNLYLRAWSTAKNTVYMQARPEFEPTQEGLHDTFRVRLAGVRLKPNSCLSKTRVAKVLSGEVRHGR